MKIAIMQPYFFPYLGYFSLIKNTDLFILLDTVQFIRHGWIERNRVLKPENGWQYIRASLKKHHRETIISDIMINEDSDWRKKILAQLAHYKRHAPNYSEVVLLLEDILFKNHKNIVDLNYYALVSICQQLGIKTPIRIFSEMGLEIEKVQAPDEWALHICKALEGVDEYWNPPGGEAIFDRMKYQRNKIKLQFLRSNLKEYSQKRGTFEEGLSIIDVLMFNTPESIDNMLLDYELF